MNKHNKAVLVLAVALANKRELILMQRSYIEERSEENCAEVNIMCTK